MFSTRILLWVSLGAYFSDPLWPRPDWIKGRDEIKRDLIIRDDIKRNKIKRDKIIRDEINREKINSAQINRD